MKFSASCQVRLCTVSYKTDSKWSGMGIHWPWASKIACQERGYWTSGYIASPLAISAVSPARRDPSIKSCSQHITPSEIEKWFRSNQVWFHQKYLVTHILHSSASGLVGKSDFNIPVIKNPKLAHFRSQDPATSLLSQLQMPYWAYSNLILISII